MKTAALLRHSIEWKDLRSLSRRQVVQELLLPVPWLAGSLLAAARQWHLLALPCSFMFFLTGLRQVHGAFHYSIGVTRRGAELVMAALSALMLGSMHAVQINHLRHVLPPRTSPVSGGSDESASRAGTAARCRRSGVECEESVLKTPKSQIPTIQTDGLQQLGGILASWVSRDNCARVVTDLGFGSWELTSEAPKSLFSFLTAPPLLPAR